MAVPVPVPKLGMTMSEATVVEWLVDDGMKVSEGEVLCVIETDKVESEIVAPSAGIVRHRAESGTVCDVGAVLAEIDVDGA